MKRTILVTLVFLGALAGEVWAGPAEDIAAINQRRGQAFANGDADGPRPVVVHVDARHRTHHRMNPSKRRSDHRAPSRIACSDALYASDVTVAPLTESNSLLWNSTAR